MLQDSLNGLVFLGPGEIKYYKNSLTGRKKSIRLISVICNHRSRGRVSWPLPQRLLECRKVGVWESLKMTDGVRVWLRSAAAGKRIWSGDGLLAAHCTGVFAGSL